MSTILALALIIILVVLILAPGLASLARPRWAGVVIPFYLLLFAGILLVHVGFGVSDAASIAAEKSRSPETICERAINESQRAGLILDGASTSRIVVDRRMWSRLPEQVRNALVECLQNVRPAQLQDAQVEVVER